MHLVVQACCAVAFGTVIGGVIAVSLVANGIGSVAGIAGLAVASGTSILFFSLTSQHSPVKPERETCCRKCLYILRGITEPRCPECGERI